MTKSALAAAGQTAGDIIESVITTGQARAYVDDLPLTMEILNDTVVIDGAEDRTGLPADCVYTDTESARDWAELLYRRTRPAASLVQMDDLA